MAASTAMTGDDTKPPAANSGTTWLSFKRCQSAASSTPTVAVKAGRRLPATEMRDTLAISR